VTSSLKDTTQQQEHIATPTAAATLRQADDTATRCGLAQGSGRRAPGAVPRPPQTPVAALPPATALPRHAPGAPPAADAIATSLIPDKKAPKQLLSELKTQAHVVARPGRKSSRTRRGHAGRAGRADRNQPPRTRRRHLATSGTAAALKRHQAKGSVRLRTPAAGRRQEARWRRDNAHLTNSGSNSPPSVTTRRAACASGHQLRAASRENGGANAAARRAAAAAALRDDARICEPRQDDSSIIRLHRLFSTTNHSSRHMACKRRVRQRNGRTYQQRTYQRSAVTHMSAVITHQARCQRSPSRRR